LSAPPTPQPHRQRRANHAADNGEHEHLDQELLRDPAAARPNRESEGHLPFSRRSARQEEAADVGACNQQDESDRHAEDHQRRPHITRSAWRVSRPMLSAIM
jgi:hypothetical protein